MSIRLGLILCWVDLEDWHCVVADSITPVHPDQGIEKCSGGTSHSIWEQTGECDTTATPKSHFQFLNISSIGLCDGAFPTQYHKICFVYGKYDSKHSNTIHSIVRRDMWEGFVVDKDSMDTFSSDVVPKSRRIVRLARYKVTIGFRCRSCKHVPSVQHAKRFAVPARSIEMFYRVNIRFQRDHME